MREFKFRAWHKGAKEMFIENRIGDVFKWYQDGQDIDIMQYTDLKDRNGKEIYEGDILHDPRNSRWFNWLVEYHDGSVCLVNIGVDGYRHAPIILSQSSASERVVIGNIHENPELL